MSSNDKYLFAYRTGTWDLGSVPFPLNWPSPLAQPLRSSSPPEVSIWPTLRLKWFEGVDNPYPLIFKRNGKPYPTQERAKRRGSAKWREMGRNPLSQETHPGRFVMPGPNFQVSTTDLVSRQMFKTRSELGQLAVLVLFVAFFHLVCRPFTQRDASEKSHVTMFTTATWFECARARSETVIPKEEGPIFPNLRKSCTSQAVQVKPWFLLQILASKRVILLVGHQMAPGSGAAQLKLVLWLSQI